MKRFNSLIILAMSMVITSGSGTLQSGVKLRDGCTKEGDPCVCSNSNACPGICFKGYHYGDESIYCQCHLDVMTDQEFAALKAKNGGAVPADLACARRPIFGYGDGEPGDNTILVGMINELKTLLNSGQLLMQPPANKKDVENALDATYSIIQQELKRLYGLQTANDIRQQTLYINPLLEIYESSRRNKPCDHFKELLLQQLAARNLGKLTLTAENIISNTCNKGSGQRTNLDPCFCGKPGDFVGKRKPGVCQVNKCIDTNILRCHCD